MSKLNFWFDPASTYSYLAAMRVDELAGNGSVEVEWRPFLLGPIFKAQGLDNSPFKVFPVKGRYMWRDVQRQAQLLGAPFRIPDDAGMTGFPRNSVLAARVAIVGLRHDWGKDFVRAMYAAQFGNLQDIGDAGVIGTIVQRLMRDAAGVLAQAASDAVKLELRQNTAEAQALDVFGAPSFTFGSELFWGNDSLPAALDFARTPAIPALQQ